MRSDPLLTASAALYLGAALVLLFAPEEVLRVAGAAGTPLERALLQLIAAGLFGFFMLNWMNRGARVGGIYGRPVAVANFAHAAIAAAMLARVVPGGATGWPPWAALALYALLASGFGLRLFRPPAAPEAGADRAGAGAR